MTADDEELLPVFMPPLGSLLIRAEDVKGEPLSHDEVIRVRDEATCIMMTVEDARKMDESRGYRDIDPENCWYDWQHMRRELGREPDLDPGPKFNQIRGADPGYQQTIRDARASLEQFRAMLPSEGRPGLSAMVKTEVVDGENAAFMWLHNARASAGGFVAEFFELPAGFTEHSVGGELQISDDSLLDWMVNDNGVLHGGYSIRYYRSTLPAAERAEYDDYIGVVEYA